jgi:hypothetical protein
VHQWTGVSFRPDALWDSGPLQVSLSIAWTLAALAGMSLSTRHGWRAAWIGRGNLAQVAAQASPGEQLGRPQLRATRVRRPAALRVRPRGP